MTVAAFEPGDVTVEIYAPDRTRVGEPDTYTALKAKRLEFGQQRVSVRIPLTDPTLQYSYTRGAVTKSLVDWGMAGCYVRITYRDSEYVDCAIVDVVDEDTEESARTTDDLPAWVTLEGVGGHEWHLSGRQFYGSGGTRFRETSKVPDDIVRAAMRANTQAPPTGTEPSAYASGVYDIEADDGSTFTVDREQFGDVTVSVQADTSSHPTTDSQASFDPGESLLDALLEYCRRWSLKLTQSWSGSTLTLGVAYPSTGTDRTAAGSVVEFNRGNQGLVTLKRRWSWGKVGTVAHARGKGVRDAQVQGWAGHQSQYDLLGLREITETWDAADQTDTDDQARFLAARESSWLTYEVKIRETSGAAWGDWDVMDKVRVHDEKRSVTLDDYVIEATLTHNAGEEPRLAIKFGKPSEAEPSRSGSRSGGGGSGHRKAGGKPKPKAGEIRGFRKINGNSGSVTADEGEDGLNLQGESPATRFRAYVTGTDPGAGEGTVETLDVLIYGDWVAGCPTCNGYVEVYDPVLQRNIKLLARDEFGGGGGG